MLNPNQRFVFIGTPEYIIFDVIPLGVEWCVSFPIGHVVTRMVTRLSEHNNGRCKILLIPPLRTL